MVDVDAYEYVSIMRYVGYEYVRPNGLMFDGFCCFDVILRIILNSPLTQV